MTASRVDIHPPAPAPSPADRPEALRATLAEGMRALGLSINDQRLDRLLDYLALLVKWNRVYNLTAVREPARMLTQHLLDCLAVVGPLRERLGPRADEHPLIVDVGSGAGLPGIPLAIVWPGARVVMVEPVGKKAAFIRQAIGQLGLTECAAIGEQIERCGPDRLLAALDRDPAGRAPARRPDLIVCRAFASLPDFLAAIAHLVDDHTWIAAMKGVLPRDELAALPPRWQVSATPSLRVPGLDAQRHLILLSHARPAGLAAHSPADHAR